MKSKTCAWSNLLLGAALLFFNILGCAQNGIPGTGLINQNRLNYVGGTLDLATIESAIAVPASALNDIEQIPNYTTAPHIEAQSCNVSRFSQPVGSSCALGGSTITDNFNQCTAGLNNEFLLTGQTLLAFDSNATCSSWLSGKLPNPGNVMRTSQNFSRSDENGLVVKSVSDSHQNYWNATIGGGIKITFVFLSSRILEIQGIHRVGTQNGSIVFDHSLYSTTDLVVTGTRAAGTRTVVSGTIQIDENRLRYTRTAQFSNLTWSANCCYPTGGSVLFQKKSLPGEDVRVDFNASTCGNVTLTALKDNSSTTTPLAVCE